MGTRGRIVQLSVSGGGVPKRAVPAAWVTRLGLDGDAHRDTEHHGGPDRAVCLFAREVIHALVAEGHAVAPGALGENVTIEGVEWSLVVPAAHLVLGAHVLVQVTRYTSPCATIAPMFRDGSYARVSQKRHPDCSRVYARVLTEGEVRAGDAVRLVSADEARHVLDARPSRLV
jgi:MOSC domain-containing protein YiiM